MLGRCPSYLRTEICATSAMETGRLFGGSMSRYVIATGALSRRAYPISRSNGVPTHSKLPTTASTSKATSNSFGESTIRGEATGSIRFAMDGEARSTFQRNRIGFCVLHPIRECAGFPCRVEKVNGTVEKTMFPKRISPHQPFKDMRAVSHEVVPGLEAEVRFTGETFEIEDHRNWTDASYKIYGTPLALPFPVEIKQGTKVTQSVAITLKGKPSAPKKAAATDTLNFAVGLSVSHPLPRVGLGAASHGEPLSTREVERLKALELAHLRVDLDLARPEHPTRLRQAAADARNLDVPLEAAVFVSDAAASELAALKTLLAEVKPVVATWLVFHTTEKTVPEKWARLAREALASYAPKARFGGGSNHYFTEINRFHPPVKVLDLVSYSINPQVHSFDIPALVENLEAQAMTVESARPIIGNRPLAISPVTLRPRFSASATGPEAGNAAWNAAVCCGSPADVAFRRRMDRRKLEVPE